MTVDQLMKDIELNSAYNGTILVDDMVLAINPFPRNPDVLPNDYIVVQGNVMTQESGVNTRTGNSVYLREGEAVTILGVNKTFSITGHRYAGNAFQEYIFNTDHMYAIGGRRVTEYVWFNMINGRGEAGQLTIVINSDSGGTAGERSFFDVSLTTRGEIAEYAYIVEPPVLYGVAINKSTGEGTRLEMSAGFQFEGETSTTPGHSDFDDKPIYEHIKRCNIDGETGDLVAYEDEAGYSVANIDTMVQFKRFYFKREDNDTEHRFYISNNQLEGFKAVGLFDSNPQAIDGCEYVYIGAYLGQSYNNGEVSIFVSRSRDGDTISTLSANEYIAQCITNRPEGYAPMDVWGVNMVNILYAVEVGSFDGAKLGKSGNIYAVNPLLIGGTDAMEFHSGTTAASRDTNGFMRYRGIDNFMTFGEQYAGAITLGSTTSTIKVTNDFNAYYKGVSTHYDTGVIPEPYNASSQDVTGILNDSRYPELLIATVGSGAARTNAPPYYSTMDNSGSLTSYKTYPLLTWVAYADESGGLLRYSREYSITDTDGMASRIMMAK